VGRYLRSFWYRKRALPVRGAVPVRTRSGPCPYRARALPQGADPVHTAGSGPGPALPVRGAGSAVRGASSSHTGCPYSAHTGDPATLCIRTPSNARWRISDVGPTLGRCWADVGAMLGRRWADVGPMLGRWWGDVGAMLGRCWADVGAMLGRCWADAGPMLGRCWGDVGATLGRRWGAVGSMLGRCWPDVGPMLARCWGAVGPMLGRCWTDVGAMLGLSPGIILDQNVIPIWTKI
jgi:hypothetical protein